MKRVDPFSPRLKRALGFSTVMSAPRAFRASRLVERVQFCVCRCMLNS
jgi:hypothetical protein